MNLPSSAVWALYDFLFLRKALYDYLESSKAPPFRRIVVCIHRISQSKRKETSNPLTAKLPRTDGPPTREKETEGADDGAVRVLRGGAGQEGAAGGGRPSRGAGGPRQGRRGRPEETAGIREVSCWTSSTSTDKGYERVQDIKPRRASSEVADGVKSSYVSNCIP